MRAYILEEFGGIDKLLLKNIDIPEVAANQVLIKVNAISINPVDVRTRAGSAMAQFLKQDMPLILGWDIAGQVVSVGANVTKFKVDDQVFGMVNFLGHGKGYAEYVAAPETHLAKIPLNTNFDEAAAATLSALTVWQFLVHEAKIKSGDKILVQAASGGVGHYAVQIAKHFGAYVIGVSSSKNKDFVLSLGADEHISYDQQEVTDVISNADIVVDAFALDSLYKSLKIVKQGGLIISLLPMISEEVIEKAKEKNVRIFYSLVKSNEADIQSIAKLLETGAIKSRISKTFPFDKMGEAHLAMESGKTVGKIIVRV
jgi:NADPH:quinone reductase-like Zn-dependent oxidoreductase